MPKQKMGRFNLLLVLFVFYTSSIHAAPWIDPGDERLRHHITVLADAGIIKTPITTWPITWGAVIDGIEQAETAGVSDAVAWSLEYVEFSFKQATGFFNANAYAGIQSDVSTISDFGTDQREKTELKGELDWLGDSIAVRLRGTWANDASDGKDFRYDGSYVAGMLGNWIINAGSVDRWWGPGWQSSLILSNNARPVDALTIQRNFSDAFEWPVLNWLGPWSFTAFVGQLEKERAIPDAKLLGARFTFRPFSNLEIGLARTAQWGGEGRPQDLSSLWDVITGSDNLGLDDISSANEPSNQLGSIDWRLGGNVFNSHSAVYMQYVGEDESNGFPSRGIYLYGLETTFSSSSVYHRFNLEFADSTIKGDIANAAYEHRTYISGYRYRSRPLGASFDNDSKVITLSGAHYFAKGSALEWRIHQLDLNRDGTNLPTPGGSVYGDVNHKTEMVEIAYSSIISDFKITASVQNANEEIYWNNQTIKGAGGALAIEFKL